VSTDDRPSPEEPAAEARLVAARPQLPPAARDRLERRLLGRPARRPRPWRLGAAVTAGLAAALLLLAVAGVAPFSSGPNPSATSRCRYVAETVEVGGLTVPRGGAGTVTVAPRDVTRYVRRCP